MGRLRRLQNRTSGGSDPSVAKHREQRSATQVVVLFLFF